MGRPGDSETTSEGGPLTPEQRAALEVLIKRCPGYQSAKSIVRKWLDEKGGDCPAQPSIESELRTGLPVAGAASTAPPDSAAKIAADLRERVDGGCVCLKCQMFARFAARVEALGVRQAVVQISDNRLEPSEREVVAQVHGSANRLLDYLGGVPGTQPIAWLRDDIIAALTPIAESRNEVR